MDTGQTYGHALWWQERPDLVVAVRANIPIEVNTIRHVATDLQPVDAATWYRLSVETDPLAREGTVTPDMSRHRVLAGTVGSQPWTLEALIPAGYPMGSQDQRMACAELAFGSQTNRGNNPACPGPNWALLGGTIFVFGEVDADIASVRITGANGDITVDTHAAPSFPRTRFYAAALPPGSCDVRVANAEPAAPRSRIGLGGVGPLQNQAGYSSCFGGSAPGGPPLPPTTAPPRP